jgi:ATP-binding cassette, subfamily C (CFTR/MRP), member 4
MLKSVLGTSVRFFDLNPVGRLLNRFSKDISNLDDVLPMALFEFLDVIHFALFKYY